ncbi:helix-turn-helix domain-containing protein [Tropicibacter sp. Alg240-R139]|uniref:helix-turn-helix domain-containing protein n=1 Tax=Tropicibacter sp. Alg240-R139 TaxID=2305991 RepID=UPI0013DFAB35|nr:helix-turn-helix domain-containing protein [Tropicibacter sp. Alg240-R139]
MSLDASVWLEAERSQYRELLATAQAVERYAERLRHFPEQVKERFALATVSAVLRSEGVWMGPERIALYQALRIATGDTARDLSRASWAMRRLMARPVQGGGPMDGAHHFLGRIHQTAAQDLPGEGRPTGFELEAIGQDWSDSVASLQAAHPLTRAAYAFAQWRAHDITPWDELLEPTIAAIILGRDGLGDAATFLPLSESHRFDRHGLTENAGGAEARLAVFFTAIRQGALHANMELERLADWRSRAEHATRHLSGRTPGVLIETMMKYPIVSGELLAEDTGCSRPSARRNLNLFSDLGLIREVTGQDRYRFWAAQF